MMRALLLDKSRLPISSVRSMPRSSRSIMRVGRTVWARIEVKQSCNVLFFVVTANDYDRSNGQSLFYVDGEEVDK